MKSSRVLTSLAFGVCLLAFVAPAAAQSNDDLYNRGTAAVNKGDAIAARDAFCAIKDAGFKDAKEQCTTYTAEATRQLNRYRQNYLEGVALMGQGKLDEAEFKFRNVKAGERVADAEQKLQEVAKLKRDKQAADAAASQSAAADATSKRALDAGIEAYNRGDFAAAKNQLDSVGGRYQGEAQNYLGRINSYNAKMSEARGYEAAKNFTAARQAYTEAARIKPDGPGDPLDAVTRVTQLAATGSAPPPTTAAPTPAKAAASRDTVKTVDVPKYLAEGRRFLARGDFKRARAFFGDVLAQDPNNADAAAAMKEIRDKDTSSTPASAADEDAPLAAAIRIYYQGDYEQADFRLKNYIFNALGKKMGLANFYAGATSLSKYYLGGAVDQGLLQDARKKFKDAKAVEGFVPPDKLVSPKIMKVYQDAT